jgi:uncharacterized protein YbcV (DUF1398 family)
VDKALIDSIGQVFNASQQGQIHFGQVIAALSAAGVESYLVDYRARQTIYHLNNDKNLILSMAAAACPIAQNFDATAIKGAILAAQQGDLLYPEFKQISMLAGCIGYIVWITGRHVCYFGRKGEQHSEHFPQ